MTPRAEPGRPRSESAQRAILEAALELAGELGYAGLTIEGIAARAGVGKQTIYRWWPSKADVLLEGAAGILDVELPLEDRGSYEEDLRAFLVSNYQLINSPHMAGVLRALIGEGQIDLAFGERFRQAFLDRRGSALRLIVDRARLRGDLPPHPEPRTIADIVFGTICYRILVSERPLDGELLEDLMSLLTGAQHHSPRPLTLRASPGSTQRPLPWRGGQA